MRWSWARARSLRVEDIPERWFWALNTGLGLLMVLVALRIAFLLIWVERPAALDTSSPERISPARSPAGMVPARSPVTIDVHIPSLAALSTRPMFTAQAPPEAPKAAPLSEPAKSTMARLNVLGIVVGDPTQAILEDTTTHKTYTVSAGQVLLDGVQVEAIEPGRVTVTWQGESIELRL